MDFGHSFSQPSPVLHLLWVSFLFPNSYTPTVRHVCAHVHTLACAHVSLCAYADPVSVYMCVYSHMCTLLYMCACVYACSWFYMCVPKHVVETCVDMCITWILSIGEMCIIVLWSLACLAPCGDPCEMTDHFKHLFYKNGSLPPLASPIMGGIPWELHLALWLSHNSSAPVYIPEQHLDLGE